MTTTIERLPDKILDFCDLTSEEHEDAGSPYWMHLAKRYVMRGLGEIPDLAAAIEGGGVVGQVAAFISSGRWMVQCLTCRLGAMACQHLAYFICPGCGSAANDGKWTRVKFPEDIEAVEQILMVVPGFRTNAPDRAWLPPEDVRNDLAG